MRLKALKLVFEGDSDHDAALELPLSERTVEAWQLQLERVEHSPDPPSDIERLRTGAGRSLLWCLDWRFRPPTDKQLMFAEAIARDLDLALSVDVVRYRGAISAFIGQHLPDFKRRRTRRDSIGQFGDPEVSIQQDEYLAEDCSRDGLPSPSLPSDGTQCVSTEAGVAGSGSGTNDPADGNVT